MRKKEAQKKGTQRAQRARPQKRQAHGSREQKKRTAKPYSSRSSSRGSSRQFNKSFSKSSSRPKKQQIKDTKGIEQLQQGIFYEVRKGRMNIYTRSLVPGQQVYDEKIIENGKLRQWSPKKSKLAAAIHKGIKNINLKKNDVVLYLGASSGTTVSHVSDVVGKDGMVFAVEYAFQMARQLIFLAETRPNIAPIVGDANKPEEYKKNLCQVDFLFQDIAQKNQVEIFLKNLVYLKPKKQAMLALKAKSIDIREEPKKIYAKVRTELQKHARLVAEVRLDPLEKDHAVFIIEKK